MLACGGQCCGNVSVTVKQKVAVTWLYFVQSPLHFMCMITVSHPQQEVRFFCGNYLLINMQFSWCGPQLEM